MKIYRQGDILLMKIQQDLNENEELMKDFRNKGNQLFLARGEISGHIHLLESQGNILEHWKGIIWIQNEGVLKHIDEKTGEKAEHNEIVLESGFYRFIRQREFDGLNERNVLD